MDIKFVEQSRQLRIEYFKATKQILKCESEITQYKKNLEDILEKMDDEKNKEKIMLLLSDVEKNIKLVENKISPYINRIKELEKSADVLFENIKERYPEITPDEIKNGLIPHLKNITY